jgi:hypothetical protein
MAFMLKEITIKATVTYEDEDFAAVVHNFCTGEVLGGPSCGRN